MAANIVSTSPVLTLARSAIPLLSAGTVMRNNPAKAATMPIMRQGSILVRQKTINRTGTSTAELLERKADFEGVVRFRPVVCSAYPMNRSSPTAEPAASAGREIRRIDLWKNRARKMAATVIRMVEHQRRGKLQRCLDHHKGRAPDERGLHQQQ